MSRNSVAVLSIIEKWIILATWTLPFLVDYLVTKQNLVQFARKSIIITQTAKIQLLKRNLSKKLQKIIEQSVKGTIRNDWSYYYTKETFELYPSTQETAFQRLYKICNNWRHSFYSVVKPFEIVLPMVSFIWFMYIWIWVINVWLFFVYQIVSLVFDNQSGIPKNLNKKRKKNNINTNITFVTEHPL